MQIGIVGKPSSGKSTFFSAATLVDVAMAAYPFTTIEPNRGVGFVRVKCADADFGVQCNPRTGFCHDHVRYVPVELLDVAGLVPDAHLGKGKGNAFLDDLRQADALIHVVDASGGTNERGEPVDAGTHDPCADVTFLEREIDYWFLGVLEKNWEKLSRVPADTRQKRVALLSENLSGLSVKERHITGALDALGLGEAPLRDWSAEQRMGLATELRKSSKPVVIAANKADLPHAKENVGKMKSAFPHLHVVACSAASERALKKAAKEGVVAYYPGQKDFSIKGEVSEKQKEGLELIKKGVLEPFGGTGVQRALETAVFDVLGMIAVFPGGANKLADSEGRVMPDCLLLPKGSTALDFAYKLHTDMGEGFIRATDARKKTTVGRDHVLAHRDVLEIAFKKK